MKVLARYCKQWANFSTRIIVIIDGDTLKTLERKIAEAFQFTNEKLILKLDRDGFCVRFKYFIQNYYHLKYS